MVEASANLYCFYISCTVFAAADVDACMVSCGTNITKRHAKEASLNRAAKNKEQGFWDN
jgi:hypothetical protein